jgi:hypothetical protein
VKEKLANTDDNLNLESSSIREETVDINTSCRSSDFQSECDEHSCAYNLTPLQCSNNAAVVSVKQVILGYASGMDVKDSREMLSVSNISCASYNLRSRNDRDSGSERVSSRYKEDTRIFVSASSENCKSHSVDDMLVKKSPTNQMISSRSYNLCSRNWYYNLRKRGVNLKVKKEIDSEENYKKQKYYKKISGYNLRPRNTHTGKLASGSRGTCLFNYNPNRHYLQVKKINDAQVENQSMISTNMSCGTYNLRPRNSPGSGSIHKEGPRICLSGLGIRCKSENVEDILVKQETSVCDDDNFSSPTSNCEKSCLHNCSGVQVKQNTVTRGGYSQIKNEIFISSSDVSCKTYNLRPRTNQGDCSELVSLQHKKGTKICSSNSGHSLKSDSAQDRKVRGEVKQETIVCDVDSLSYNVCSGVQYQKVGGMGADMKLINDKNNKPKFCGERSPYKLRNHCRNDYYKYNESELHKNNYIKSAEIVAAEGIIPRINVNCSQFCEETQNLEENASVGNSMHVISEVTSSERSVSYDLRSRCIIKEILHKELAFRKDTKEEKGSEAENTLFETSRTVPGESIPIKSSKNVNGEHLEQRLAGIKGIWPPSVNNPVTTTEIHNLGNVGFMNDSKSGCTKESFYEDLKQEIVAKCADGITSVQESSVIGINETNLDELICLRSERQVQKNVGNQKHCIFHNKSPELEFLQNCQSHESCIGQDGLQVFGDKKHSEEIDCFEINTVDLHPSGIRSDFEPCEELDIGTEPCLLSAHSGCLNNSVAQSEKVQIDFVEHPDAHDENIGGVSSQTDILSYDSLNDLGDSHTGCEKLNNQDLFITETLRGLVCNENNAESAGTLQDTKEFPCNETSFVQDATSTWQQTISDTDNSIHKEQDLLLASNVNMTNDQQLFQTDNNSMIREQNLICIDNTNIAEKQKYVGDISHTQSCGGHSKGLLNTGNDPKGSGIIYETDNFLTAVDVDVNGTNTIEISVPQKAGNDCKKSDISVPVEMPLPEIGDALTAEDFNMDGPNTLKISDARKSLFTEDDGDRIPDATDSQDRNVSDVDMVELCMSIPVLKLSLVDGPVPRFGMRA